MEEELAARPGSVYEFRLVFDSRDPGQIWKASLIHALDVWSQVELVDRAAASPPMPVEASASTSESVQAIPSVPKEPTSESHVGLRLITANAQVFTGYLLFTRLARSLRLLWPLALLTWIPGVAYLGQALWPGSVGSSGLSTKLSGSSSRLLLFSPLMVACLSYGFLEVSRLCRTILPGG